MSWMIEIWMKNHLVSDNICDIVNLEYAIFIFVNKEWQIMVGLHLVLVILHKWFTISIEQDE